MVTFRVNVTEVDLLELSVAVIVTVCAWLTLVIGSDQFHVPLVPLVAGEIVPMLAVTLLFIAPAIAVWLPIALFVTGYAKYFPPSAPTIPTPNSTPNSTPNRTICARSSRARRNRLPTIGLRRENPNVLIKKVGVCAGFRVGVG